MTQTIKHAAKTVFAAPLPLLAALLLLVGFGVALFFQGQYDIRYAPAIAALLVMACAAVVPGCLKGRLAFPASPFAAALFAFWVFITLSLLWSSVPFSSLVTYLVISALPLCFFTPLALERPRAFLTPAFTLITAALAGLALWGLYQHFTGGGEYGRRAHLPLGNPNNLAGLFNLALFPALGLMISAPRRSRRHMLTTGLALLLFAGLLATGSRGGFLCFLLFFALMLVILRHDGIIKNALPFIGGAVLVFGGMALADNLRFAGSLTGALTDPAGTQSLLSRFALWDSAAQIFKDHFLAGTGLGTFYLYYAAYRHPGRDDSAGQWVHMDPLQYGAELGFIGPLLFYTLAALFTIRTARSLRALPASPDNSAQRATIAALACGTGALILHTHFTFHLYIMPVLVVLGLWLALWYESTAQARPEATSYKTAYFSGWQKPFMALTALCIAGLVGLMAASSAAAFYHVTRAQEAITRHDTGNFMAHINKADRFGPASFIDDEIMLAGFYADMLGHPLQLLDLTEQNDLYEQGLTLLDYAESFNPVWAEIDNKRASLQRAIGRTDMAMESWRAALRKNPGHVRARIRLASAYMNQGRASAAYDILRAGTGHPQELVSPEDYQQLLDEAAALGRIQQDHLQNR